MRRWELVLAIAVGFLSILSAGRAEAQLSHAGMRFSIDADVFSVAGVERDPDGPAGPSKGKVIGLGPNHEGGKRATGAGPTSLALGVGWVLTPKIVIGGRVGFGYDVVAPEGASDNTRILALSIMPGLTFVPMGEKAKLFLTGYPIFQVDRAKTEEAKERTLLGGFGLGVGTMIFVARSLSVDLGFHFEGRFGSYEDDNENETDVRDLRGLLRLGLSLWK